MSNAAKSQPSQLSSELQERIDDLVRAEEQHPKHDGCPQKASPYGVQYTESEKDQELKEDV
jgi:hypothetical protein